jgi:hypothetical protein
MTEPWRLRARVLREQMKAPSWLFSVRRRIAQDFGTHKLVPAYRKRALSAA